MSFEMAPNNFEVDFEKISFNRFEFPDRRIFQDDIDPEIQI